MVLDHSVVPAVVLVVEDEMLLRMRAIGMVEDAGYTSVEAVDADEATAILESRSDIVLLFTDIQIRRRKRRSKTVSVLSNRMSKSGTKRTRPAGLTMSVHRGRPDSPRMALHF
jgi:CheY-like chemotaxis protein